MIPFRYPNNWRLGIDSVNKGDEGDFQCQINTHPPKVLTYQLKVIGKVKFTILLLNV